MCIIVYKPKNKNFPKKKILEKCFNNNPDGAGFMYAKNDKVTLSKGYMTFEAFWDALMKARKEVGEKAPYVMHFRIGTQGGNTPDNTHPFPLSSEKDHLKALDVICGTAVAHNGVIAGMNGDKDMSDTQIFIKDFLSPYIRSFGKQLYYKNINATKIIESAAQSKLAILSGNGHCELIGDFEKEKGVYYSNSGYRIDYYGKASRKNTYFNDLFIQDDCPSYMADFESCYYCAKADYCYTKEDQEFIEEEVASWYGYDEPKKLSEYFKEAS